MTSMIPTGITQEQADQLRQISVGDVSVRATDYGNAERLVQEHGRDLRFVAGQGWLAWDGRHWRPDSDGEVMRRAKQTVRSMYDRASDLEDEDERKALAKHATRSEAESRLRAAVTLASTEREVIARPADLDADPLALNVANGAIDLRDGSLMEHGRGDLMTRIARAAYTPEASSSLWEDFIRRITGGDDELAAFLRRAAGYSLTGDTGEEKLFFAHGPTATGKSTFLEGLKAVLGTYAATTDFNTFLQRRGDPGVRNDIARLAGTRLVVSIEVEEGKRLAEGLIKLLTGGDTVAARHLYAEFFEFEPQFKLWLAANARPRVNADDAAIWRRIVQVPFTELIPEAERDPAVKRQIKTDPAVHAGILSWAVEGCLDWQEQGLAVPERVLDYTAEYRAENDLLAEWIAAKCVTGNGAVTSSKDLRDSYMEWAQENGEDAIGGKRWGEALRKRDCEKDVLNGARAWKGIALS